MIKKIKFNEGYWFSLEKESQKRFKTKTIKPTKYSREKEPYDIFYLFDKDFEIDFKDKVNVIVGENGSGKSTLISILKQYAGEAPNKMSFLFKDYETEDEYFKEFIENRKKENKEYKITGDISYRNAIFFNAESDNPVVGIPKMLNPDQKSFPSMVNALFCAQEESHGESLIPILDYILDNAKNCIIFLDEPETALSLKNQIRLADKIQNSADKNNNQIILSTHSFIIISKFNEVYDMESRNWMETENYLKQILNGNSNFN